MQTLNEKLGLFEKTMTTGLDTVNTLLFYVDSKLYRGYADMVERGRLEFEKRYASGSAQLPNPKTLNPKTGNPGDGAAVPKFPNIPPRPRQEDLYVPGDLADGEEIMGL